MNFIYKSFRNYLSDIANWRSNAIAYKTVDFLTRNFVWFANLIKNSYNHGIYEVKKIGRGFKNLFKDVLIAFGIQQKGVR